MKEDDTSQVTCNHCDANVSAKIERIRAHLANCLEYCSEELSETLPVSSESSFSQKSGPTSVKKKTNGVLHLYTKQTYPKQFYLKKTYPMHFYPNLSLSTYPKFIFKK